jgi:hypothetical protein
MNRLKNILARIARWFGIKTKQPKHMFIAEPRYAIVEGKDYIIPILYKRK